MIRDVLGKRHRHVGIADLSAVIIEKGVIRVHRYGSKMEVFLIERRCEHHFAKAAILPAGVDDLNGIILLDGGIDAAGDLRYALDAQGRDEGQGFKPLTGDGQEVQGGLPYYAAILKCVGIGKIHVAIHQFVLGGIDAELRCGSGFERTDGIGLIHVIGLDDALQIVDVDDGPRDDRRLALHFFHVIIGVIGEEVVGRITGQTAGEDAGSIILHRHADGLGDTQSARNGNFAVVRDINVAARIIADGGAARYGKIIRQNTTARILLDDGIAADDGVADPHAGAGIVADGAAVEIQVSIAIAIRLVNGSAFIVRNAATVHIKRNGIAVL